MSDRDEQISFVAEARNANAISKEMTSAKRPPAPVSMFERKIQEINNAVQSYGMVGLVTMIILTALAYVSEPQPLALTTIYIGIPIRFLGYAMFILILLTGLPQWSKTVPRLAKKPSSSLC